MNDFVRAVEWRPGIGAPGVRWEVPPVLDRHPRPRTPAPVPVVEVRGEPVRLYAGDLIVYAGAEVVCVSEGFGVSEAA